MRKILMALVFCSIAGCGDSMDPTGPTPNPGVDATPGQPQQPDAAAEPQQPGPPSLGLVYDPGFTAGQGEWRFDGAEMAPDAKWNVDPGVVHLLETGATVSQTIELPSNEGLAIRVVWRGTATGVLRAGNREKELPAGSVWSDLTWCLGTLAEPASIDLSVDQTNPGLVELDQLDVVAEDDCFRPYP